MPRAERHRDLVPLGSRAYRNARQSKMDGLIAGGKGDQLNGVKTGFSTAA